MVCSGSARVRLALVLVAVGRRGGRLLSSLFPDSKIDQLVMFQETVRLSRALPSPHSCRLLVGGDCLPFAKPTYYSCSCCCCCCCLLFYFVFSVTGTRHDARRRLAHVGAGW